MPRPEMHRVQSSNIVAVGYDGTDLYIQFHHGGTYRYENVSAEEYDALVNASSVGAHFHQNIKSRYDGVQV